MNKVLFLTMALFVHPHARSQDEGVIIRGSIKVSKKMTPQQVIDSLNARFPNAHAVRYYKIPPDAVQKGWTISKEDNLNHDESIDYYTITFKRDDFNYYGLFAADGRLIRSKQEQTVNQLPEAVKFSIKALGDQYPGYKVVSKKYFRNLDASSEEEYYEVIAQKDGKKKSLYYEPDGTLLALKD